eukprot:171835_1
MSRVPSGRAVYDKAKYPSIYEETEFKTPQYKSRKYKDTPKRTIHRRTKSSIIHHNSAKKHKSNSHNNKTKIKKKIPMSKSAKKHKRPRSLSMNQKPMINNNRIPIQISMLPETNEIITKRNNKHGEKDKKMWKQKKTKTDGNEDKTRLRLIICSNTQNKTKRKHKSDKKKKKKNKIKNGMVWQKNVNKLDNKINKYLMVNKQKNKQV